MKTKARNYSDVVLTTKQTIRTGNDLLDDFWSTDGGMVRGSSILLTGTSGAGKTTFGYFLQKIFENYKTYMYSREMSAGLIRKQMERNPVPHKNAFIADEKMIPNFDEFMKEVHLVKPEVIIVDSIQVIMDNDLPNITNDKDAAQYVINAIREWAEKTGGTAIVIGQLTKEGEFKGPSDIQFLFDGHLEMRFDRSKNERRMFWVKNRLGPTAELFYTFIKDGLKFYTPDQWACAKDKLELQDFIDKAIKSYISLINTNSPNYKKFMSEFRKEVKDMQVVRNITGIERTVKVISLLQNFIVKYDLKAY